MQGDLLRNSPAKSLDALALDFVAAQIELREVRRKDEERGCEAWGGTNELAKKAATKSSHSILLTLPFHHLTSIKCPSFRNSANLCMLLLPISLSFRIKISS